MLETDTYPEKLRTPIWTKIDPRNDFQPLRKFMEAALKDPEMKARGESVNKIQYFFLRLVILLASFKRDKLLHMRNGEEFFILKDVGGDIKGTISITPAVSPDSKREKCARISGLYVHPGLRSRPDIFMGALSLVNGYCLEHHIRQLWFAAQPKNSSVIAFYRSISEEYKSGARNLKDEKIEFRMDLNLSSKSSTPVFDAVRNYRTRIHKEI